MCDKKSLDNLIYCTECDSWLHYSCIRLWAYQAQAYKGTNRKFTCPSCITVQKDLPDFCFDKDFEDLKAAKELLQIDKE